MFSCKDRVVSKPIRVIAAACSNMGIGKAGQMPWNLPKEFQFFLDTIRAVSRPGKKNLMIWGRSTWFSFPENLHPITNGIHVVLSHTLSAVPEHAHHLCHDFDSAVQLASCGPISEQVETIWVNGGAEVYREALGHPWCDLVYLTDIRAEFHCDTFFPLFDRSVYRLQERFPESCMRYKKKMGSNTNSRFSRGMPNQIPP